MSKELDIILAEQQNATVSLVLAPPTSISGWTIQFDLLHRFNSPQPIVSLFMASGYINGESGLTLVDGVNGIFNASLSPTQVSGLLLSTNVICYQCWRTDAGQKTPIVKGYRLLVDF